MSKVRAKKALGQHFLTNPSVARAIAESVLSWRDIPILEIGPGMGMLTKELLDLGLEVYALEIDTESVDYNVIFRGLPKEST